MIEIGISGQVGFGVGKLENGNTRLMLVDPDSNTRVYSDFAPPDVEKLIAQLRGIEVATVLPAGLN